MISSVSNTPATSAGNSARFRDSIRAGIHCANRICILTACVGPGLGLVQFAAPLAAARSAGDRSAPAVAGVKALETAGIHNLFALGTNVYSGSSPEGPEGLDSLARLGVKTIITVDGAKPDVEGARELGMRYVHLPHGYDGINTNLQMMLAKAGLELEGPIYVHCHHGKHRGPAAAAVVCMADQGWNREQAEAFLKLAGTSTNYSGLYETIRNFEVPSIEVLNAVPSTFPETADVSGLVEVMVGVDERWEHLQAVRAAGYGAPPWHPDIDPVNEAVILWEHYREAQRLPEVLQHGEDMVQKFRQSEAEGREAERLLRLIQESPGAELKSQLDRTFDAMDRSCSVCHKAYRNPAGIKSTP